MDDDPRFPDLPDFPVDDVTLGLLEHALASTLTFDRPDDADPDDEGPWRVGGDMSMADLLDFLAGVRDDPHGVVVVVEPGEAPPEHLGFLGRMGAARVEYDPRPHYSEHDVIAALIAEVRRLRAREEGDPRV